MPLPLPAIVKHALAGILISHISHLLAVTTLYHLTFSLVPASEHRKRAVAFTASCLHVLSPAGLFLSAPYGESTFAFLNFAGMLAYATALRGYASFAFSQQRYAARWLLLSGLCYGLAAMVRSNGLLSGMPFLWDAVTTVMPVRKFWRTRDPAKRKKFAVIIAAGSFVAVGFVIPQIVAYTQYCTHGNTRPWCTHLPPSIYNWVQSHYWGVGFFKYWTLNNLPLFLLATPLLALLVWTSYLALQHPADLAVLATSGTNAKKHDDFNDTDIFTTVLQRLAIPQLFLALLAVTSFHVQIINRISSGYAVWYITLAIGIHATPEERMRAWGWFGGGAKMEWVFRAMVMYALVQGGLFACFLPPA